MQSAETRAGLTIHPLEGANFGASIRGLKPPSGAAEPEPLHVAYPDEG